MIQASRFPLALALAAFAHVGAWWLRPSAAPPSVASVDVAPTFEVEIAESSPNVHDDSPGGALENHARTSTSRTTSSWGGVVSDSAPATGPSAIESAAPATGQAPTVSVWNVDALTQDDLGVGDTRSFAAVTPRTDAEVVHDRVQRGIEEGLRDRELAAGDPVSGPIVRALEDSASRSLAPVNGSATFDAVISAGGVLLSINAVGTPAGKAYWDDVAKESSTTLVGKKLHPSKRGLVVRIEITSREQLPSGSGGGVGGDVLSDGSGQPHALDVHVLPTAPSTKNGWGRKAEFTPLVGSFDVSDIGATKRRVIGAHVTAVRDL